MGVPPFLLMGEMFVKCGNQRLDFASLVAQLDGMRMVEGVVFEDRVVVGTEVRFDGGE